MSGPVILEILRPILRILLLTLSGYAVFKIRIVREKMLNAVVWVTMNVLFTLYFVDFLPTRWAAGDQAGWVWAGAFFLAYFVFLGVQLAIGRLLINRFPLLKPKYPREFIVLFAMQNAGYIPLPIVIALAPRAVELYLSFFIMAFMITFFTVAVWLIQGGSGGRIRFKINAPIVGMAVGLVIAVSGVYPDLPTWVRVPLSISGTVALDIIMFVLGAVLASIPRSAIRFHREFGGYILVKMVAFPLVVLGVLAAVPLRFFPADIEAGIKLALVLEAAVPPATNIMVITKAVGSDEQVQYAGGAIVYSYLAAVVILPIFLILSRHFFS